MKNKKKKKNKVGIITLYVLVGLLYVLACTIVFVCDWTKDNFNVGIDPIIFTITNPIKGTNTDAVGSILWYCIPKILVVLLIYVALAVLDYRKKYSVTLVSKFKKIKFKLNLTRIARVGVSLFSVVAIVMSVFYVDSKFDLFDYIEAKMQATTIYEDYYINPKTANIKLKDGQQKYKNVIQIYMESMEIGYSSANEGGIQDVNYIPYLTQMAKNNVSFSNTDKLGGFRVATGTSWTMGALLALTSGVPYAFPIGGNEMGERISFSSGLTTIGDVLGNFGYQQYFQCGSDASFGGRESYFVQHGNYKILDYYYAVEKGYIPEDYYVWWGYEDYYLYQIAKTELTEISKTEQPFNYTMLTVDTHSTDGYVCNYCENKYDMDAANIASCADRQVYEFIEWCKQQPFYEDTIIVITGDHPSMKTSLIKDLNIDSRYVYNCFINCDNQALNTTNRDFTTLDMFPTIMGAMGFEWDCDRLGLGTNLFSSEKTLSELIGYEILNKELSKKSNYYMKNFY